MTDQPITLQEIMHEPSKAAIAYRQYIRADDAPKRYVIERAWGGANDRTPEMFAQHLEHIAEEREALVQEMIEDARAEHIKEKKSRRMTGPL